MAVDNSLGLSLGGGTVRLADSREDLRLKLLLRLLQHAYSVTHLLGRLAWIGLRLERLGGFWVGVEVHYNCYRQRAASTDCHPKLHSSR